VVDRYEYVVVIVLSDRMYLFGCGVVRYGELREDRNEQRGKRE
jgi:hypothetical protein